MAAKDERKFMGSVARDFMDAASRAYLGYTPTGQQLPTVFIPSIVCCAFAAELNLKVILLTQGKKARGHDLAALYALLPAAIKNDVRKLVNVEQAEFAKQLARIADAFVDWRYVYEAQGRSLNFIFLGKFAAAVASTALQLSPMPPPSFTEVKFE
jgi:hypothetical protein